MSPARRKLAGIRRRPGNSLYCFNNQGPLLPPWERAVLAAHSETFAVKEDKRRRKRCAASLGHGAPRPAPVSEGGDRT